MNKDDLRDLTGPIRRLTGHLFSDDFVPVMLDEFASLLNSPRAVLLTAGKGEPPEAVVSAEYVEGKYREDFVSEEDFPGRFGFGLPEVMAWNVPKVQSLAGGLRVALFPSKTERHGHLLLVECPATERYLSREHLAFLGSLVDFALNARSCARSVMGLKDLDVDGVTLSAHRIKGTLSSISTAFGMLTSDDLSDDDRKEVARLAQKGINELMVMINAVCKISKAG